MFGRSNKITVNSVDIVGGRNVSIINGKVLVDGKDVTPNAKEITIQVIGDVDSLDVDYAQSVSITGNVQSVQTAAADVTIGGGVAGSVQTASGDVDVDGDVQGSVATVSGDVDCCDVAGNVTTVSGDITQR